MTNIKAAQSGNWSSTSTWSGGVIPGSGDVAFSNNFTVTVDTSVAVDSIRSISGTGITAGGHFEIASSGVTLTLVNGIQATDIGAASGLLYFSHTTGTSTVTANNNGFSAGPSSTYIAIINKASGFVIVNGNVNGGPSGGNSIGVYNESTGTITVNGNVLGGFGVNTNRAVVNNTTGTITVNGNVSGGTASNTAPGVSNTTGGTITINGNVVGGSGSAATGAQNISSGTLTINGSVTGGAIATSFGATNTSSGTMTITGDISASSTCSGANNGTSGALRVGTSGSVSTLTPVSTVPAINGAWMVVTGADIAYVIPTDANFPAYTGTTETLSVEGTTTGDGLILLSDIADVIGAQLEAALS